MPGTELADLHEFLASWPDLPSVPAAFTGPHRRLALAARDARHGRAGSLDLAGLIRHVLRSESLRRGRDQKLSVPADDPWPDRDAFAQSSMRAVKAGDQVRVRAEPWFPRWVDDSSDPFKAAFRAQPRGITTEVLADPLVTDLTGFVTYRSVGLRESLRAVLSAPPGSSLAVSLPTGAGKTSVFIVPALRESLPALTLVVVPTVALALDLEARIREMPAADADIDRYAYVGGMPEAEREAIRRRIREGTQRVVFTAPESVLASLRPSLHVAAEAGSIRRLVLDEAHLVAQWGDSFRPAYQHLAGLWRTLVDTNTANGFRPSLLLLSATLTDYSLGVIESLFSPARELALIGQLALRPEHEYWIHQCAEDERDDLVLQTVAHAPRPVLLYTTEREHANRLYGLLESAGYQRLALFTGATGYRRRQRIIDDWRSDAVDLVVATSAFGLGVDKADVRTVIHATVPESLDRYYQEVGRAGRDGNAATAMLLWTRLDLRKARGLAEKRIVTGALARRRWRAMLDQGDRSDDLDVPRANLRARHGGILDDSDLNQYWNLQVLQLMRRAGFLDLLAERRPTSDDLLTDDDWEDWYSNVPVRVLRGDLATDRPWEVFEQVREEVGEAAVRGYQDMKRALQSDSCFGEHLVHTYRITDDDWWVQPALACGGCSACRQAGRPSQVAYSPPFRHRTQTAPMTERLQALGESPPLVVRLEPASSESHVDVQAIERLVAHGIRHFFLPQAWIDPLSTSRAISRRTVFIDNARRLSEEPPPLFWSPSCVVWETGMSPNGLVRLLDGSISTDILIVPDGQPDPRQLSRVLCEMVPCVAASQIRNI